METQPYLVGLTGGSASGKTLFLNLLKERFNESEVCFISQDDYYKPENEQYTDPNGKINFDLPEAIDLDAFHRDLVKLTKGETIRKQTYNFNNPAAPRQWIDFKPSPIIIIEGLFIFYYQDIFDLLSLKLFIDADEDIKLQRRIERDIHVRGIAPEMVTYQWFNHVKPAFLKYLAPYKEQADIIVINNRHFSNSLQVVENHFRALLANSMGNV